MLFLVICHAETCLWAWLMERLCFVIYQGWRQQTELWAGLVESIVLSFIKVRESRPTMSRISRSHYFVVIIFSIYQSAAACFSSVCPLIQCLSLLCILQIWYSVCPCYASCRSDTVSVPVMHPADLIVSVLVMHRADPIQCLSLLCILQIWYNVFVMHPADLIQCLSLLCILQIWYSDCPYYASCRSDTVTVLIMHPADLIRWWYRS